MSIEDIFNASTGLGKLSLLTTWILITLVVVAGGYRQWFYFPKYVKDLIEQRDKALALAKDNQASFDRSLDVIERMQNRRRSSD